MTRLTFALSENDMPTHWYNIVADLPERPPRPLHPVTQEPMSIGELSALTSPHLLEQDGSTDRWIEIPDAVRSAYALWRPTPMRRALALEEALQTPARIYYKYEGVSPTGSHKPNSAIPQAYYNHLDGIRVLTTETGAGQWGAALSFACARFQMECQVYWVGSSYDQKPYRRILMDTFGAQVHRSPSVLTEVGRREREVAPDSPGSIGLAVSEAVEVALSRDDARYALGSTAGHVLLHQTVIGQEAIAQFALAEDWPDVVISCVGGGSSLGGVGFPFLARNLAGERQTRILAVEPTACPALTRGRYAWDHGDKEGTTPLMKMYTLGHGFVPHSIHAGGLRYHGMSPLVSYAKELGWVDAAAKDQRECFEAGVLFTRTEGILPAPESTHALASVVEEALEAKALGEERVIFALVTGHGDFDLSAYEQFAAGELDDVQLTEEELQQFLDTIPEVAP